MNTHYQLTEIAKLIKRAEDMLQHVIEANPKPVLGKPPQPSWAKRIESSIWKVWDQLKPLKFFTAADVKKVATGDTDPRHYRSDPAYSNILSRWAQEGYLEIYDEGTGPNPTLYRIPAEPQKI